jgi:predicted hydrolase (HD superfamily)
MADRASVWNLLTEFTQSESLRKHALAVEACMRAYARKFATDEELWSVVGLLHDFDYEKYPSSTTTHIGETKSLKNGAILTKFVAR